ncbi:MAG: tetratricopeptide repeat protein [Archangiaceae bacterium]|nr:tetratricopeptide repeat protein [Archangiaceae bacterium]
MTRSLLITAALFSSLAQAQDLGLYNRALSAFNASNYNDAAQLFFEVNNSTTDPDLRMKSEYYLASSFQKKGMPVSAFIYFDTILRAGKSHPFHLKAVEGLVNVQDTLDDQYLIPSELNKYYDPEAWATLPSEVLARVNFLIATIDNRRGKLDEGRDFALAVPPEASVYLKAQYLLGLIYADPRYPGDTKKAQEDAVTAFETVVGSKQTGQKDDVLTKQLALLGEGRVYYGLERFDKSTEAYEKIPRFSKYWDQALFENGFARYKNDDLGGGLGSLQALHAPQFIGAFQPESWYLKSVIYYESCLYEEAKAALGAFDEVYLPMAEKLKPIVEAEQRDVAEYFKLVDTNDAEKVPVAVLNFVRGNERMLGVFSMLKQIDAEKKLLEENSGWRAARLSAEVTTYLDSNRGTLQQVAGTLAKNRLIEAYKQIRFFADQAEIVRFETSKAEKNLAEAGVDQRAVLKKQAIYRPQMPAENWNYWKFQGEFWRDEIGYYQYTLKKGCPESAE